MATGKRSKARRKVGHYKAMRKDETLGLRITKTDKDVLERAARELGVPVSEFVLSAALKRARAALGE